MSKPPSPKAAVTPAPAAAPAEKKPFELPTEEHIRTFWERNQKNIYFVGAAVILAIIVRGGYQELLARREAGIEAAFAAATTPEKLRQFAREHDRDPLAGVAYLQLADVAYAGSRFDEAQGLYQDAAAVLTGTPFAARAALGQGICLITAGKTAEGTAILRRLADDPNQLGAMRCEAAYHLASLAFDAGNFDEVLKDTDLILQVDATSIWAQRGLNLRARMPAAATAPAPAAAKSGAAPEVSIKLPGS